MIRLMLLAVLLMAIPSALSLKLAVSPEVLLFGKERTERIFTVMNPNDGPITVEIEAQDQPTLFRIHPSMLTIPGGSSEVLRVTLERPIDRYYVEDLLLVSISQEGFPVSLRPGVGIRLSALGEVRETPGVETAVPEVIVKEPKGSSLAGGLGYSIMVLGILGGLIVGFRRLG